MTSLALATLALASWLPAASAGALCPNINGIKDAEWIQRGGDNVGFEWPSEIRRKFPGTLDRECDGLPDEARPDDFCLPRRPFARWDKKPVCKRCPPRPHSYFRLPLWQKYLKIRKEMVANGGFRRANRHLFERGVGEFGRPRPELKSGFCLTCYALARRPPAQVLGPTDIRKPSVTVTTRIACGKQNEDKSGFDLPDQTLLDMFDGQLETMQDPEDPCTFFPCGSTEALASKAAALNRTTTLREDLIARVFKKKPKLNEATGQMEQVAVNGHHNDLMEIPFDKAHVLQAEINLNPGLEGYTDAFPDGGYVFWNDTTRRYQPYQGCQALEYGMVALSPGEVETACWLVPLFEAPSGGADPAVDAWRRRVRQEDQEIRQKVLGGTVAAKQAQLLRRYCVEMRPRMNRGEQNGEYERGTRTCEVYFCATRRWNKDTHPEEFDVCRQVMTDAANYRRLVAEKQREAQGGGQGRGQGQRG